MNSNNNKKPMISRRVTIITMLTGLITIGLFVFSLAIFAYQPQAMAEKLNFSIFTNTKIASNNMAQVFHESYEMLINNSHLLTQSYQKEIGKWQAKQYDNKTMISVTDNYLPKFQQLVYKAEALQATNVKYIQALDLYIKSLQSEIESYKHFRNFLVSGNSSENEVSTQLLSDAFRYEMNSFAAFNNATNRE
jgi:uncharacterized Fe-S radical SAM superfamily protein PflX